MVQLFMALGEGEIGAFRAYAETYPDECVLLVDTINTLESGVPNAITVFHELRAAGHEPVGIRLDSGDLAHLAVRAARLLEDGGFPDARIVLSSELDELAMWQIRSQIVDEAPRYGVDGVAVLRRLVYGVGTRLVTSHGSPSLGGVYKLVAIDGDGGWIPAMKISDTPEKMPIPGGKRVWRAYDRRDLATADVAWKGIGTMKDLKERIPVAYAFQPEGSLWNRPPVWGWIYNGDTSRAYRIYSQTSLVRINRGIGEPDPFFHVGGEHQPTGRDVPLAHLGQPRLVNR
jgi:putative nicotinate phosphoribosyltransferase